jgi:4-hydroxy-2-oxoheptanedioate aldolase
VNVIQQAMAEGRPSYGLWASGPSATSAEVIGRAGPDWALLDMQHGAVDAGNLLSLIQALEVGGGQAMVRVAQNDPPLIMRALDLGAIGVVVPMVSTPEQARAAAQACRYPPAGNRSFGPVRGCYDLETASTSVTCLVMIETAQGLANLDGIAATPGVDGLFVGPMDLGLALGDAEHATAAEGPVADAVRTVVAAAERHGVIAGVAGFGAAHAESLLAIGARLVTLGSDVGYLKAGLAADLRRTREWTERFARPPGLGAIGRDHDVSAAPGKGAAR